MAKRQTVTVYDTPSGLGGSHTVSIVREIDAETVEVRVWYGRATATGWERWPDWPNRREAAKLAKLWNVARTD